MIGPHDITTYVVNLPRRPDRRAWIHACLPAGLPVIYTSDMDATFDGCHLTPASLHAAGVTLFDWQIDSANPWCYTDRRIPPRDVSPPRPPRRPRTVSATTHRPGVRSTARRPAPQT